MPVAISNSIQAVEVEGTVYVGGETKPKFGNRHIVMAYNTQCNQWDSLPPYSAEYFSMAVINKKLVLVGGYNGGAKFSRELGVWQASKDRQWTRPFPPMPTARSEASSICYKHWLVVAGGYKTFSLTDTVEILDVNTNYWSTGPSTPTPWGCMKSVVIEDTWYLMGDKCGTFYDVYSASLEAIVTEQPPIAGIWQILTPLYLKYSCPLNIGGSLLAVGGKKENKVESAILCYEPETSTWVPAGELPQPLYNCICISMADKVYVFGGRSQDHINVYYHTL